MGCVQSSPEDEKPKAGTAGDAAAADAAAKARRRLSVAPQHVGSIDSKELGQAAAEMAAEIAAQDSSNSFYTVAYKSKKGFVPYNSRKQNQDAYLIREGLNGNSDLAVFDVFDGHGEFGELVSGFVRDNMPKHLEKQGDKLINDPVASLTAATASLCKELTTTTINRQFSGTTAVYGLRVGKKLHVANIGDSRCIVVRKTDNGSLEVVALSYDHKPDSPGEKERILKAGGRVMPLPGLPEEDCGPHRVWLGDVDVPGLAMSRSIGDDVSHKVGVLDIPEIITYEMTDKDMLCIWASDGVWEFLSNEDVAKILNTHAPNWDMAVSALVDAAHKKWKEEEEVVDDITCVLLGFK